LVSFCCFNLCECKGTTIFRHTQTFTQKSFFFAYFYVNQYVKDLFALFLSPEAGLSYLFILFFALALLLFGYIEKDYNKI